MISGLNSSNLKVAFILIFFLLFCLFSPSKIFAAQTGFYTLNEKWEKSALVAETKKEAMDRTFQTVLTGSFNFTESAEDRNAENLLVIQDPTVAAQYEHNWRTHKAHSSPYR